MATTDRTDAAAPADALAGRLREATFAHLLARADGESIAAAGLLADACVATGTPYQVSAVRTRREADARRAAADGSATTIGLGVSGASDPAGDVPAGEGPGEGAPADRPSVTAFAAADALGAAPDPALALAGVVAGGGTPEDVAPSILERAPLERRPGLSTPTTDAAAGLAHTTLAHADYSGDPAAAESVVERIDEEETDRRLASLLAIDAVGAEGATDRAAGAIERAIHPLAGGPLETVEGLADVLAALAATAPGLGVALALGGGDAGAAGAALDAWRQHAVATHDGVRSAATERHSGLLVARTDGPVEAVARLLRDFRSPEPAVLAIGGPDETAGDEEDGDDPEDRPVEAAIATVEASAEPIEAAAETAAGSGLARGNRGYARFDADREAEFVDAIRGAI